MVRRRRRDSGEGLTERHGRYLGDIPLAHVAVKLVGAIEHCEEREPRVRNSEECGARARRTFRDINGGKEGTYLLPFNARYLSDIPLAHVAVKLFGVRTLREREWCV